MPADCAGDRNVRTVWAHPESGVDILQVRETVTTFRVRVVVINEGSVALILELLVSFRDHADAPR